jgi:hypothetical protein
MLGSTQGKGGTARHLLRVTADRKSRPMPSVSKGRKGQNSGNVVNIKKANTRMSTPLVFLEPS